MPPSEDFRSPKSAVQAQAQAQAQSQVTSYLKRVSPSNRGRSEVSLTKLSLTSFLSLIKNFFMLL